MNAVVFIVMLIIPSTPAMKENSKELPVMSVQDGPFYFNRSEFKDDMAAISWKFPPSFPETPLKGVMLLFPGCTHNGDDFFRLGEERQLVDFLLKSNYAAVALSSKAGRKGCWVGSWPTSENKDAKRVLKALDVFFTAFNLNFGWQTESLPDCSQIPVFLFGASSGGGFVSILPYLFAVDGVIVHISPGHKNAFNDAEKNKYPPTAFVYMSGDKRWASEENINKEKKLLLSKKIPSTSFGIDPFALSVDKIVQFLGVELLNRETVAVLFNKLRKDGYVRSNGLLRTDPRSSDILERSLKIIKRQGRAGNEQLISDNLEELFNSAFGQHELSHVHFADAVAFLWSEHAERCPGNASLQKDL